MQEKTRAPAQQAIIVQPHLHITSHSITKACSERRQEDNAVAPDHALSQLRDNAKLTDRTELVGKAIRGGVENGVLLLLFSTKFDLPRGKSMSEFSTFCLVKNSRWRGTLGEGERHSGDYGTYLFCSGSGDNQGLHSGAPALCRYDDYPAYMSFLLPAHLTSVL